MIVEIQIGGKYRTIRFNNWQKEALGKLYGADPLEAGQKMVERWGDSLLSLAADLVYTGLIGDYRVKLKDLDFTREQVMEWVGDADDKELATVINTWSETEAVRTLIKATNGTETEGKKKSPGRKLKTSQSGK